MTSEPRVLIVTRRYWPLANDAAYRLLHWAGALTRQGYQVTILTARWQMHWPARFTCREIPVVRIEPAPTSPFRVGRYAREVTRWVVGHRERFDTIYCDSTDAECQALLAQGEVQPLPPIVVRFDPTEFLQPYSPDAATPKRALLVCKRAHAIVVPRPSAQQRLVTAGVADQRIARIADAPLTQVQRSDALRVAARKMLADINRELFLRSTERLVVCPGDLDRRWAIETLIQAIGPLLDRHAFLRLWILGEGSYRARLGETLRYHGWHNLVNLPGSFEDIDEVMRAADLWLLPSQGSGAGWLLPTALVSGLPTLVCDSPEIKHWLASDQQHLAYRNGDVRDLRTRLEAWIDNPRAITEATQRVRGRIVESARPLEAWNALFAATQTKPASAASS